MIRFRSLLHFTRGYTNDAKFKRDFISTILQSTVTRREAKDYLKKYDLNGNKNNISLIILEDVNELLQHKQSLKENLTKLLNLGVSPIMLLLDNEKHENKEHKLLNYYKVSDLLDCTTMPSLEYVPFSYKPTSMNKMGQRMIMYRLDERSSNDDLINFIKNINKNLGSLEKIIILNQNGGIPFKQRNWNSHIFMNMKDEYNISKKELDDRLKELEQEKVDVLEKNNNGVSVIKQALFNLELMNESLNLLPLSSTGLITSYKAMENNNPIIHNILTDRALVSCSLPMLKDYDADKGRKWYEVGINHKRENIDVNIQTTVLKKGVDITIFKDRLLTQFNSVGLPKKYCTNAVGEEREKKLDLNKMKVIIKESFGRELDLEHYLDRINGNIFMIIIIGDYEGIAILTYEKYDKGEIIYLDKLGVLPHLKGSLGISDLMFVEMFDRIEDDILVWRSRKVNVVNKWYFQRSKGTIDLDKIDEGVDSIFRLFYYCDNNGRDMFTTLDKESVKSLCREIRDIQPSWKT
ncbi:related to Amino-acid acetyltransferase, mitochondrial [Hanseniaspora guilliermondii]|uniref:Amino-acid acetyltransferase, mitochondrial n=1 Tax=Hanseniaspora guilliermondii TaxID=56406 RepID=A0A1L0B5V7_9ASCO|nr:related to Amino-acid acetyltransferase, mitochondrial [Hanseniaspora guilliermondii]